MFITFEGIEGSGKTSQSKLLSSWLLNELKHDVLLTKEPGSPQVQTCKKIREIVLDPQNDIHPKTELLLYLADRAQHVAQCVRPALDRGMWVVCDRYIDSTLVYQGYGRGFDKQEVSNMIEFACFGLKPGITILLDIPVDVGIERAKKSNKEFVGGDRLEREPIAFHNKIRQGFLDIAQKETSRFIVVDANRSVDEIHEDIKKLVLDKIHHHYFMTYNFSGKTE